jgi:hypothetical protein
MKKMSINGKIYNLTEKQYYEEFLLMPINGEPKGILNVF